MKKPNSSRAKLTYHIMYIVNIPYPRCTGGFSLLNPSVPFIRDVRGVSVSETPRYHLSAMYVGFQSLNPLGTIYPRCTGGFSMWETFVGGRPHMHPTLIFCQTSHSLFSGHPSTWKLCLQLVQSSHTTCPPPLAFALIEV